MQFKTAIFNIFRQISKVTAVELFLAQQIKNGNKFAEKFIADIQLYPKNSIRTCTRNGINYRLDVSDYMEHGIYFNLINQPDFDRRFLYSLIKEDFVCLDIGANIGETTLNFAKLATKGKVYSFEPVPFLFERLKTNISLNSFKNIQLHNIAISDKNEALFFDLPSNHNSAGISLSKQETSDNYKVKAITLDDFVEEQKLSKIDIIKIDVEGFENFVINGAYKTIQRLKPIIFIEIDNRYLQPKGTSEKKLLTQIRNDFAYSLYRINGTEKIRMEAIEDTGMHYDVLCVVDNAENKIPFR
ncbi:MAG: hypothetical protein RJA25_1338 [Bacteroidota bacterium]